MIDVSKPVVGRDVENLRQKLGLSAQEMSWMLGIPSMARWSDIIKKKSDQPVSDINIALMVRVLDEFPELNFVPEMPTPNDVMQELTESGHDITLKRLGVTLGGEASSGYRWLKMGTRASPAVKRTCLLLLAMVRTKKDGFKKWESIVTAEATARRIRDVFAVGKWKEPTQK